MKCYYQLPGFLFTFSVWLVFNFGGLLCAQSFPSPVIGPGNAYRLPVSGKAGLQNALDTYKIVVLDKGDYRVTNSAIILRSGYQLFGDPAGTIVSPVIMEPGTTGAVLSTVSGGISFPASTQITSGNVIERLVGKITVNGASMQDNLFLHTDGQIQIDTRQSGFMRNNRFIRCKSHAVWPQLVMQGDTGRQSYGNVFVWYNFLTPHGDATNITNQKDFTLVGFDAETWNQNGLGTNNALIKIGPMGTLRIFGANGGNHGSYQTPAFDVSADEFQIYNNLMEPARSVTSDYVLRPGNLKSLFINSSSPRVFVDEVDNDFSVNAFESGSADFEVNGTAQSSLTPEQQESLSSILVESRTGEVWEAPRHRTVPDPAGPLWNQNLAGKPDNTDYIQGLIDTHGVARLPAGIYYISRPLKIGISRGIVGAGAGKTVIIAKNNTLDIIVANDKDPKAPTGRKIIISGITLQGGANGIHFEPVGTGTLTEEGIPIQVLNSDGTPKTNSNGTPVYVRAQYTACYFNDVTFRDMSVAGVFMDQIYALDNIFLSYLNFINCNVGWKQKVDPAYNSPGVSGETPTMMYMDKVMFYSCQFTGNRIALELPGNRGCNLNAWVNCKFENNRDGVAVMTSYSSPLFSNCDFINNGGSAVISSNMPVSYVSCRFGAGGDGISMFRGPVSAEGCSFDRAGSSGAKILTPDNSNVKVFFINCTSVDMPLGLTPQVSGMLINSEMMPSDQVNKRMLLIKNGVAQPLLTETTDGINPKTQLLFGTDWSSADTLLPDKFFDVQIEFINSLSEEYLEGLEVKIYGVTYLTDNEGKIVLPELAEGSYSLQLPNKRFEIIGNGIIGVYSDTLISVYVKELQDYSVQIEFVDSISDTPMAGMDVVIDDSNYTTNSQGIISIPVLMEGNYKIVLPDPRFRIEGDDNFEVRSDSLIRILVTKIPHLNLKVINRTSGLSIYRTVVKVNDMTYYTNSSGFVNLGEKEFGSYIVLATHNDFFSYPDTLIFDQDTTFIISMTPKRANVVFQISDANGYLSGVKVSMSGSQTTNSLGKAFFYYQPARVNYNYSVEKAGYIPITGTFNLEIDTTLELTIDNLTGVHDAIFRGIEINPGPFKDYINIGMPENGLLNLYDISGRLRYSTKLEKGLNTIPTSDLENGGYIVKIIEGERVFSKLMIK